MKRLFLFSLVAALALSGCGRQRTDPALLLNTKAEVPANLPFDPLAWRVITSGANVPDETMSTLYGNDAAIAQARSSAQHAYPTGAVLALVTWAQQEDPHWYGAKIPGEIKSIEFVQMQAGPDGKPLASYQSYEGSPLAKAPDKDAATQGARIDYITNLRASVMP